MLQRVIMPKLGDTMEEGTVISWIVAEGDSVAKGQHILSVETDKATLDVESLVEGTVLKIVVLEGESVPIGQTLAFAGEAGDTVPEQEISTKPPEPVRKIAKPPKTKTTLTPAPPPRARTRRPKISPRAAELADRMGVDLTGVSGTGPGGRITSRDVNALVAEKSPSPAESTQAKILPLSRWQKLTAEKMLLSRQTIPCFELTIEIDASALLDNIERWQVEGCPAEGCPAEGRQKPAVHDVIIMAVRIALLEFPVLTGCWTAEGIIIPESFGIGLAIAVGDDLVAPVVHDVASIDLSGIAERTRQLVAGAKSGRLEPADLCGACTTISNMGMLGIDAVAPIVIPGQGSIIGVGQIKKTPSFDGQGKVVPAMIMKLTISVDHRLASGACVARFLKVVKAALENPGELFRTAAQQA